MKPPVPLELQEQAIGGRSPQQTNARGSIRGRFSFRQQITGLFKPGHTLVNTSTTTAQPTTATTTSQSQVEDDSPNTRRRSNFYVEPVPKEYRYCKNMGNICIRFKCRAVPLNFSSVYHSSFTHAT